MSKCLGCGAILQADDIKIEGFTKKLESNLCERCFRIQNYNEYKKIEKDNTEYIEILKKIDETDDLVMLVVDLFNFHTFEDIEKYIHNDILLVLTKRDLLPKGLYEEKLLNYFNNVNLNIADKIIVSSNNNYNLDLLYDYLKKYKHSQNVYVIGHTSAGKSTLINRFIYHYSDMDYYLTTSNLPSTTLNTIPVLIDETLTLIDTPGLLVKNSIVDYIDEKTFKKIIPKKYIKPITYQVKSKQTFFIEDLLRIDVDSTNNIVFYFSNTLNIKRTFKDKDTLTNLAKHIIEVKGKEDIVINGLGFIKVMNPSVITLYTLEDVSIYTRPSFL